MIKVHVPYNKCLGITIFKHENQMNVSRSTMAEAEILQKVKENYGSDFRDVKCMFEYRGLNDIYKCTTDTASFYFKIYARKDIDKDAVRGEVEVVNHLRQAGLSVAYPIPMKNGQYLLPIEYPEGTRFGVLFSAAEGNAYHKDPLDNQEIVKISRLLSEMYTMLDAIPTSPKRWKLDEQTFLDNSVEILEDYSKFYPLVDLPFIKEVVKELKEQIQANAGSWNWGLCHGDVNTGNIHRRDDGKLTIIDFDFCGYGWRAYDPSPILGNFSAGINQDALDDRKRRLEFFLRAYQHAGGFSDSEIEAIYKVFVPFRRIFNLGYLYNELHYVWGNSIRNWQIINDTRLLHEWVDYYW